MVKIQAIIDRKILLIIGIVFFMISIVIKLDSRIVSFFFEQNQSIEKIIQLVASTFGAIGGIFVALYYVTGFIMRGNKSND